MFSLRLLLVARGTLAEGLAFPISYNILEALFVGSPGENILQFDLNSYPLCSPKDWHASASRFARNVDVFQKMFVLIPVCKRY